MGKLTKTKTAAIQRGLKLRQSLTDSFQLEMIEMWFWYLNQNEDYRLYIDAKKNSKKAVVKKLEKKYKRIAAVYDDFGDTRRVKFSNWIKSRKHLFITPPPPTVQLVAKNHKPDASNLYIQIPLQLPIKRATEEMLEVVRAAYNDASAVEKAVATNPKYSLTIKNPAFRDWLSLLKIQLAWELFEQGNTPTDVVFKMIEEMEQDIAFWDAKNWTTKSLNDKGNLNELRVQAHQFRKQARNIIDNTIDGVFPRKSPRQQ